MAVATQCFKQRVLDFKTHIFCERSFPPPREIGISLLTKIIPMMDYKNDFAFAWHWKANDVCLYSKAEYEKETEYYITTHKMKRNKGDTVYHYDFIANGKKRRCILMTEIWYVPDEDHNISPIAYLFGQFMGCGLHITKCSFSDVA
jgi:hypothetical protein